MFSDSMNMISNVAQFFKWVNFFILNKNVNPYLLLLITETQIRNTDTFMLQPKSNHGKKKLTFYGKQTQRPKGDASWAMFS